MLKNDISLSKHSNTKRNDTNHYLLKHRNDPINSNAPAYLRHHMFSNNSDHFGISIVFRGRIVGRNRVTSAANVRVFAVTVSRELKFEMRNIGGTELRFGRGIANKHRDFINRSIPFVVHVGDLWVLALLFLSNLFFSLFKQKLSMG